TVRDELDAKIVRLARDRALGQQRRRVDFEVRVREARPTLRDVDRESPDLMLVERLSPCRHSGIGEAFGDAAYDRVGRVAVPKRDPGERRARRRAFAILAVTGAAKLLVRTAERARWNLWARGSARERDGGGNGERQGAQPKTQSGREHDEAPL